MNPLKRAQYLAEDLLNKTVGPQNNPFYRTVSGPMIVFLFFLLFVSGIYLLLFYRINVSQAYDSVQYLTHDQWYLGGIMRSIHRYASDIVILAMVFHGIRMLVTDRFKGNRWLIWISGISLFVMVFLIGVTGYWMVWDQKAQLVAIETLELLDVLPVLPKPLAEALVTGGGLTDLLFFAVIFVHIGVPFFLAALFMLHIARISDAKYIADRKHWVPVLVLLLVLSLVRPALSAPPADLSTVPVNVPIDWFYLFLYPAIVELPGWVTWAALGLITVAITVPPWLRKQTEPPAQVIDDNCTGCTLCNRDCPYDAIRMVDREEHKEDAIRQELAVINEDKCSSCGTCLGACNYRAIEIDEWHEDTVKDEIDRLLDEADASAGPRVLSFVCENSVEVDRVREGDTVKDRPNSAVFPVRCAGMVNPPMINYALDQGFEGVFVSSCQIGDCYHRLGNIWLRDRLEGKRPPKLQDRKEVADAVEAVYHSPVDEEPFYRGLDAAEARASGEPAEEEPEEPEERVPRTRMIASLVTFSLILALVVAQFSVAPTYSPIDEDSAQLTLTMRHETERVQPCVELSSDEIKERLERGEDIPECPRERVPAYVELSVDGEKLLDKRYSPSGVFNDGPAYVYEKVTVPAGEHTVEIRMRDSREDVYNYTFTEDVEFDEAEALVIGFDEDAQEFGIRTGR